MTYTTELRHDHGDDSPHHMIDHYNADGEHTLIGEGADAEKAHFLVAAANAYGTGGFERVTTFHEAFGLPVNGPGLVPTLEERLLRGRLLLEEVVEHLTVGLGLQFEMHGVIMNGTHLRLGESEIHDYDPVETLDGLCDIKVIANGTGVAFGLPVPEGDRLVYESNMAKLVDGKPVINGVTPGYRDAAAMERYDGNTYDETGYRPDLPHGKVLKPAGWSPPDMASLFKPA